MKFDYRLKLHLIVILYGMYELYRNVYVEVVGVRHVESERSPTKYTSCLNEVQCPYTYNYANLEFPLFLPSDKEQEQPNI